MEKYESNYTQNKQTHIRSERIAQHIDDKADQ